MNKSNRRSPWNIARSVHYLFIVATLLALRRMPSIVVTFYMLEKSQRYHCFDLSDSSNFPFLWFSIRKINGFDFWKIALSTSRKSSYKNEKKGVIGLIIAVNENDNENDDGSMRMMMMRSNMLHKNFFSIVEIHARELTHIFDI